ncbi:probable bifunctional dTTP/UTP pyrophosphatase/methyltransferase protein [Cololabis saira]|uniref:probable bifunctional dTTP/UTP pyrophosphatase/methyltransferase protein n=1 Tax=Cololabis saira TaxID=129043 RepID=UPI002AD22B52|nr:probable bifunctional dTTP/UTP pyrophosphatase/methyltransferase protein [Cololabis saira]
MVLQPVISKLAGKLVVLASSSQRRLEILRNAGLRFEVVPSWFQETLDKRQFSTPQEYAVETARQKALEVARRMPFKHLKTPDIVIGADTIVTVDGMILEKPKNKDDAYRMLSSLSGKEHSVFTGVAIVVCYEKENDEVDYQLIDFYEETRVKFSDLSEELLWEYINSGEPMDKAGGYGIQALGGMLVESVHGDFHNVVGFPLNHFCRQLDVLYNHVSPVGTPEGTNTPFQSSPAAGPVHRIKKSGGDTESTSVFNGLPTPDAGETSPLVKHRERVTETTATHGDGGAAGDLKRICELIDGFKASKALFSASSLGVFDLLSRTPGLDAAQVAHDISASVRGTERLLEACVSLGLLEAGERGSGPRYQNSPLARRFLCSDSPWCLQGYLQRCDQTLWPLFSRLEAAVVEGRPQRQGAPGAAGGPQDPRTPPQDAARTSRDARLRFMDAMDSYAKVAAVAVATAFDLSSFKTACDLGGCTGALARELTKAHPGMSVLVFDLPAVVELSDGFHQQSSGSRVTFTAGDFLQDSLPQADLFILARILHDLPEEKLQLLLGRVAAACRPGGGLLLSEVFLDPDRSGPPTGLLQALSMSEGRQRSAAEYRRLLAPHGFTCTHTAHTHGLLDAMLLTKTPGTS